MNKRISQIIIATVLFFAFAGCKSESLIQAEENFTQAQTALEAKNAELDTLIAEAQDVIDQDETALDDSCAPALETAISQAKAARTDTLEMPKKEEEIVQAAEEMNAVDYTAVTDGITQSKEALETSIRQYKQVDNPSEAFVIERLTGIEHIKDISAVTEDNDPNGHLGKQGGYTAAVYYSDDRIDLDTGIYGTTVIEQATDGGGCIEVYANVDDAKSRDTYLAGFDGGIFASGSHTVIGTVVVRTSDELTASQQKEMEADLIAALTEIRE